ncbi:MAG: hypothetical protein J6A61_04690 [Clostridia bacterium]|nr:hypothetical protein [Clostridia bacterium]
MKKMKKILLLLLATTLCLTACTTDETTADPKSEEPELTQEEIVNYMSLAYVNGASTDANYQVETDVVLPDRHFVFEDVVSNPAELLAYEYFYAIGTGDYEYLVDHTVGSNLKREMQTFVDMDAQGLFYKTVTLHEMEIVPIEDFFDFQYDFCEDVAYMAGAMKLSEYTVVKARASYEFNDLLLEVNPDEEAGEITRYLFVGRTDGDYYLIDVYGDDYVE